MHKFLIFSILLAMFAFVATAQQAMNNDAIIKLVKAGLSDDLIVSAINAQPGDYDTSTPGLGALQSGGVSEKVIAAMVAKSGATAPTSPPAASAQTREDPTSRAAGTQTVPTGTLLDGTPVRLRLSQDVSSANASVGQEVPFEVVEDISVDNVVVLPKGAKAIATVIEAEHKKSMSRAGKLNIAFSYVLLRDQERVKLRGTTDSSEGRRDRSAKSAASAILFTSPALLMLSHGKDVTLPQGTEITALVDGSMLLNMINFSAAATATPVSVGQERAAQAVQEPESVSKSLQPNIAEAQSATSSEPQGEATIVVYRTGSMLGAAERPAIFVNGEAVGELRLSNFVEAKVPRGKAVVSAIPGPELGARFRSALAWGPADPWVYVWSTGNWASTFPSCKSLDLIRRYHVGRLRGLQGGDATRCEGALNETIQKIESLGRKSPKEEIPQACRPYDPRIKEGHQEYDGAGLMRLVWYYDLAPCEDGLTGSLAVLKAMEALADTSSGPANIEGASTVSSTQSEIYFWPNRFVLDVEAGRIYYVEWSVHQVGFRSTIVEGSGMMRLVDGSTGEREIRKLQLARSSEITNLP